MLNIIKNYAMGILLVLTVALGAGSGFLYYNLRLARQEGATAVLEARQYQRLAQERQAHQEASDALYEAAINTVTRRAQQAQAEATLYKERNRDLQEAINANRDWADSPIPPGVLNALKRP